jgi:hypothetical protein
VLDVRRHCILNSPKLGFRFFDPVIPISETKLR